MEIGKLTFLLIISVCGGILYRLGGTNKGTKWRDIGVPLFTLLTIHFLIPHNFVWYKYIIPYFLTFLLMMASLTTYRYFLPKPQDYQWWHYALHGLFVGLSAIPLVMIGLSLWVILIRSVILAILLSCWSHYIKWDVLEEMGRGALIITTLSILII